jgi:hypothetical protein
MKRGSRQSYFKNNLIICINLNGSCSAIYCGKYLHLEDNNSESR